MQASQSTPQPSQSNYTIDQIKKMEIKDLINVAKELYENGARRRVKKNNTPTEQDVLFSKAYDRLYNNGYTIECILKNLPPKEKPKRMKKVVNEPQSE